MKKSIYYALVAAIVCVAGATDCNAQKLGSLLKKGKKTLEQVIDTKPSSTADAENTKELVAPIVVNGIEVINPIAESIEVVPVGLYGVTTSENFGNVYLVLNVTMKGPKESATFGSSIKNQKMIAVDGGGHVYNINSSGAFRYDTPESVPVKIVLDEPDLQFTGVSKVIAVMPIVKFGINIDAYHQDNLTLKNVPIFWDQTPE